MVNVYTWPPALGIKDSRWSVHDPVQKSRSLLTGKPYISAHGRRRQVVDLDVSVRHGVGYGTMEGLIEALEGGIHFVRIERYGQTDVTTRAGAAGYILGTPVAGTPPSMSFRQLAPEKTVARAGEFIEYCGTVRRLISDLVASASGTGSAYLDDAFPMDVGEHPVVLPAAGTGIFEVLSIPEVAWTFDRESTVSWRFREAHTDEIGAYTELAPWGFPDAGLDFYVATTGSDAAAGTEDAPFATLAVALAASSTGDRIGVMSGQTHLLGSLEDLSDNGVGVYGGFDSAYVESTQALSGKTWTLDSGTTWKTTVTLSEASTPNGTGSNTFIPKVWFGNTWLDWKVGGADIAANIASVGAAAGSFAVNVTGSTTQDVRSDVAATGFDVYVNLPDGSDPNGQDVRISDRGSVALLASNTYRGLIFRGAFGKDQLGIPPLEYATAHPVLVDCQSIDAGEHCWVGPLSTSGTYTGRGRPTPGMTGFAQGRGVTTGFDLYTNVHNTTTDLTHGALDMAKMSTAVYGHGSGNQGYRNLTIESLLVDNTTTIVKFDVVGAGLLPFFTGTVTIGSLTATNIDDAFYVDGAWVINGGSIAFDPDPINTNRQQLAGFTGTAPSLTLKDMTIEFTLAVGAGKARYLAFRNTSSSHTAPILILDNVQDISASGKKGHLARGGTANIWTAVALTLKNGTVIGSIQDQAAGTNYPASLTVEAGCTFGMGNRTGPQIEAALTGAGVTHSISHDTTIVGLDGVTVYSSPGW